MKKILKALTMINSTVWKAELFLLRLGCISQGTVHILIFFKIEMPELAQSSLVCGDCVYKGYTGRSQDHVNN